jgi:hypothetical protein
MASPMLPSEITILNRLLKPDRGDLPITVARALLKITFDMSDRDRMRELLAKAKAGSLTTAEQAEIDSYERVGHFLDLLHSKARLSLKRAGVSVRANA